MLGFDLDGAKIILNNLATLHAVPIALKLLKPEMFESKIEKLCERESLLRNFPKPKNPPPTPEWLEYIKQQEECQPYISMVEEKLKIISEGKNPFADKPICEPFATISHCDFWCNNTMQKMKNKEIIENKLVDFQVFIYANQFSDLIFFLFSSVQNVVLERHLDELITYYYNNFVNNLKNLGCNTDLFEYAKFFEKLEDDAGSEFLHLILMAIPIHAKKGVVVLDFEEQDASKILKKGIISKEAYDKITFVVKEFGKRGWLK